MSALRELILELGLLSSSVWYRPRPAWAGQLWRVSWRQLNFCWTLKSNRERKVWAFLLAWEENKHGVYRESLETLPSWSREAVYLEEEWELRLNGQDAPGSEGRALKNYLVLSAMITTVFHGAEMDHEEKDTLWGIFLLNSSRELYNPSLSKMNCGYSYGS